MENVDAAITLAAQTEIVKPFWIEARLVFTTSRSGLSARRHNAPVRWAARQDTEDGSVAGVKASAQIARARQIATRLIIDLPRCSGGLNWAFFCCQGPWSRRGQTCNQGFKCCRFVSNDRKNLFNRILPVKSSFLCNFGSQHVIASLPDSARLSMQPESGGSNADGQRSRSESQLSSSDEANALRISQVCYVCRSPRTQRDAANVMVGSCTLPTKQAHTPLGDWPADPYVLPILESSQRILPSLPETQFSRSPGLPGGHRWPSVCQGVRRRARS